MELVALKLDINISIVNMYRGVTRPLKETCQINTQK